MFLLLSENENFIKSLFQHTLIYNRYLLRTAFHTTVTFMNKSMQTLWNELFSVQHKTITRLKIRSDESYVRPMYF